MKHLFARLGDWRLPVIFAIPILIWAGLLYAVLQPLPSSATTASRDTSTITEITTPRPTFVPVPYPTFNWPAPKPTVPCAHQTLDPMAITMYGPNHQIIGYREAEVCAP